MATAEDNTPPTLPGLVGSPTPSSGMTYQIATAIAALQIECLKSVAPIKSMDIHLALKLIGLIESIYLSADKATDSIFTAMTPNNTSEQKNI